MIFQGRGPSVFESKKKFIYHPTQIVYAQYSVLSIGSITGIRFISTPPEISNFYDSH